MGLHGVILARFQPVHEGHIALIKKACDENERVLLLVGSANQQGARNPIPLHLRIEMLKQALIANDLMSKCIIEPFDDLTTEEDNSYEWGFYLYSKVVDVLKESYFTIYYSDGYEIITSWFPGHILRNYISLSLLARAKVEKGISATQVRDVLMSYDKDDETLSKLKSMVPESVFNRREMLREVININIKKK